MEQPYKESIEGKTKKRREYVQAKMKAYATAAGVSAITLILVAALSIGFAGPFGKLVPWYTSEALLVLGLYLPLPLAVFIIGIRKVGSQLNEAKSIPYVAPSREQIAALPGNQVLLRSSDAPPGSDSLLRAASGSETVSTELLRPTERTPT